MKPLRPLRPFVLTLLVFTTGCASLGRRAFVEPEVALREVQIAGIGLTGGTLHLLLDVTNPNSYLLRTLRIETAIDLDRTPFGTAVLDETVAFPADSTMTIEVPLQFTWEGVGAGARSLLRHGAVPYTLRGRLQVRSPLGHHGVPIGTSGTVTLRDLLGPRG